MPLIPLNRMKAMATQNIVKRNIHVVFVLLILLAHVSTCWTLILSDEPLRTTI